MLVPLCAILVLLFALAIVALVYAIATADGGYEDENGFHSMPIPVRSSESATTTCLANRTPMTVPLCWML